MNGKKLVRSVAFAVVLAAAFVTGSSAASTLTAGELPDCNCIVYNFPEPGEHQLRYVVEDDICLIDECYIEIETK
jgi:hypothetical protein